MTRMMFRYEEWSKELHDGMTRAATFWPFCKKVDSPQAFGGYTWDKALLYRLRESDKGLVQSQELFENHSTLCMLQWYLSIRSSRKREHFTLGIYHIFNQMRSGYEHLLQPSPSWL